MAGLKIITIYGFYTLAMSVFLTACNFDRAEISLPPVTVVASQVKYKGSDLGRQMNNILLAELYHQFGETDQTVSHYQALATESNDVSISKRGTELAARSDHLTVGLELVRRWIELSPDDLEAQQYLALILLRDDQVVASANQLHKIYKRVEDKDAEKIGKAVYSKGLKFIGTLLSVESRHQQAFNVYQNYLEQYDNKEFQAQQNMVLAALAMKAEKYGVVVTALNSIDGEAALGSSKLVLMKVKAYKEMDMLEDAVIALQAFVDGQKSSDSDQLELVRLLILNKQKSEAKHYLLALVKKHPDNNDLLKSLIAIEIDQSKFGDARKNIVQLKKAKEYVADAEYFLGEILEAEGDFHNALVRFKNVKQGTLLKRAQKKVLHLSRILIKESLSKKVNYNLGSPPLN